jgi:hypothetical protein
MQIILRNPAKKKVQWEIPIEPEEYNLKPVKQRICTFDTETDPFAPGRIVRPFTCGILFTDTGEYKDFWGDDCIDQFFAYMAANHKDEELLILVHNGGNFDFYFFVDYFDRGHSPFIINGRLVRVMAQGFEFRDSYVMIPVALAEYDKIKFDYNKMERENREYYKQEILFYQRNDCIKLAELVTAWYDKFGNKLTMASVALPQLRSFHGFETLPEKLDADLRPFFFGGRTQCFSTGIHEGNYYVYDINSSYPNVMANYNHPVSDTPRYEKSITDRSHFAFIKAYSNGALPIRAADGSLSFPVGVFDFYACIHEIRAAQALGCLRIIKCYYSIYFDAETNFADFVTTFYSLRMEAALKNDGINKLFYKLVLNSSYGKFAQDPRKYENWLFDPDEPPEPKFCAECYGRIKNDKPKQSCTSCDTELSSPYGWYLHTVRDGQSIYAAPQRIRASGFYNVATAASITSAARAELLYGIKASDSPIYCDTDSIICKGLAEGMGENIRIHNNELGAWDLEAKGDKVCIAGKKLYAIFKDGKEIKKASKGVKLTAREIERVCAGEVIEYANPVPKFGLNGEAKFVTRNIRITG